MDRNQPQAKGSCGKAPKQKGRLGARPEAGSVPANDRGAAVAGSASSYTTSAPRAQRDGTPITTTIPATNTAQWYSGEPIRQQAPAALRYAPYLWPMTMIRNNTGVAGYARYPVTGPVMPTPYGAGVWRPYRRANGLQFSVQPPYRPPVMRAPAAFRYGVYSQQVTIHQHPSTYNPYPHPSRPRPVAAPIQIITSGAYRPESPTNNEPTVTSTTTSSNGVNQA